MQSKVFRRSPGPKPGRTQPEPGLCGSCRHGRSIVSQRGSAFWLCGRAADDPSFPKYPPLPVLRCRGYEPAPGAP